MKSVLSVLSLAGILMFSSCDKSRVFEDNVMIEKDAWYINNKPSFYIDIQDTVSKHNLYLNLRNTGNYKYSNLFVLLTIQGPGSKAETNRFEFRLAEHDGKWLGTGLGDMYSNRILMIENMHFPKKGVYSFSLEQNMRDNPLQGIEDVGIRLERK